MDNRRSSRRSAVLEEWEAPARQSPPRNPQPTGKLLLLGALAVLLVVAIVGTTALVLRSLHNQSAQNSPSTSGTPAAAATSTTSAKTTPTADLRDPANNGWTRVSAAKFGDTQFAPSSPQRGYLCGLDADKNTTVFGATTDGGQTWQSGQSPAAYPTCSLQISPTNALDVALTSINAPGDGNSIYMDAHYSSNGGKTWQAAPVPQKTLGPGGILWSGSYLYVWSAANKDNGQQGFFKVSANGGAFTSIDEGSLLSGVNSVLIDGMVASGTKAYLTISYSGCSAQNCLAVVASGDGGKTWTQVPNQSKIALTAVVGNTLYGVSMDDQPFVTMVYTSTDNGATWKTITLPPLSGSQGISSFVVAPDQTIFVSSTAGVSYLHGGAWTTFAVSSSDTDSIQVSAISLGTDGHAQRVWGHDDSHHAGVYWHALP